MVELGTSARKFKNGTQVANYYSANLLRSISSSGWDGSPDAHCIRTLVDGFKALRRDEGRPGQPIIVVIDQAEELFTDRIDLWKQRKQFLREIHEALDPNNYVDLGSDPELSPPHLVLVIREDFLANLLARDNVNCLPELKRHSFRLEPLRPDQALLAMRRPLQSTNARFGESVAEELLHKLRDAPHPDQKGDRYEAETVEPLYLQVTCLGLWNLVQNRGGGEIESGDLKSLGSIEDILGRYYDPRGERCDCLGPKGALQRT